MKVTELRIGNLVNRLGVPTKVTAIQINSDEFGYVSTELSGAITQNQIEPIPLSEEYLLRFGFNNIGKQRYSKEELQIGINDTVVNWVFYWDRHLSLHSMSYVHQLQNLFFSLIGEELQLPD